MDRFLFFIIFSSFMMLCIHQHQQQLVFKPFYQYYPRTSLQKNLPHMSKINAQVAKAMCLGEKRGIPKQTIQKFKDLQIMHLLTPSGLHFSSLYFPLKTLLPKNLNQALLVLIFILSHFLLGFFALKRVILYHVIRQIVSWNSTKGVFLLTFFIALLLGSYKQSPLSFIYSFLFWGVIIGSYKKNKLLMMKVLVFGQVMLAYFNSTSIFPIAHAMNFLLTTIITSLFPLIFINFFANFFEWQQILLEWLTNFILFLINVFHAWQQIIPAYSISLGVLGIYFVILFMGNRKILLVLLLLNSGELTPPDFNSKQIQTPKMYKPFSANCQEGFINGHWYITTCKKKKSKKLSRL